MASKVSSGTATYTASTRTISGATMTPVFELSDQTEQRQIFFSIGASLYYGRVQTYTSATQVILQPNGNLPANDGTIANIFLLDLSEEHSYADYLAELQSLIKDEDGKLTTVTGGDLDKILAKAVRDYSRHKPFFVKKKITGNGTSDYVLSTIFGGLWTHGYSQIKSIEYPIGEKPKSILDKEEYEIYDDGTAQDGSNLKLRFISNQPSTSEYFIVEFSVEMNLPVSGTKNFPDTDEHFSNITTLAAALACQRLAAVYAQSKDSTIGADIINYHDKSAKYSALYKQYLTYYNLSVFGKEEPELSLDAALVELDVKPRTNEGRFTLFHR